MKYLHLVSVLVFATCTMAMPSKVSLSLDEDYGSLRQSPDHYQMFYLAPVRNEDHQRHNFDALRAYIHNLNMDSQMLRKLLLSKLSMSPDLQIASDASKIKKNFDEIDKASSSFSTINQLT